jgi:hypothetical protein
MLDAIGVVKEVGKCVNGTDTKKATIAFKIADLKYVLTHYNYNVLYI